MSSALALYTLLHVVLSLLGMFSGLVTVGGFVAGRRLDRCASVFLVTTVATNISGFGFPFEKFLPSHAVAIVSIMVVTVVIVARYFRYLAGPWRGIYVVGAVLALYLNVFILLAQLFSRLPALSAVDPTQKEAPFLATEVLVLMLFVWLGAAAVKGFRTAPAAAASTVRG